jgi:hypothetical protein
LYFALASGCLNLGFRTQFQVRSTKYKAQS